MSPAWRAFAIALYSFSTERETLSSWKAQNVEHRAATHGRSKPLLDWALRQACMQTVNTAVYCLAAAGTTQKEEDEERATNNTAIGDAYEAGECLHGIIEVL